MVLFNRIEKRKRKLIDSTLDVWTNLSSDPDDLIYTYQYIDEEDPALAIKLLFYLRDPRHGLGLKKPFKVIMNYLAFYKPEVIINNLPNILIFGRGDDYYCFIDTPVEKEVFEFIKMKLDKDMRAIPGECSLLAKWLKSENASSKETKNLAKRTRQNLHMSSADYRKMLSSLRRKIGLVEQDMSNNDWDKINFKNIPIKAFEKYSDAFRKHCYDEYMSYCLEHTLTEDTVTEKVDPLSVINSELYSLIYTGDDNE